MSSKPYSRNCELLAGQNLPDGMSRIALGLEYNGAFFHGFQTQRAGVTTVQSELEWALSSIANEPVTVVCAGRTDAGVHATNQVVHFDTLAERKDRAWVLGTNTRLVQGISVQWAKPVAPQFHARFSAQRRTYRYIIYNGSFRPALMHDLLAFSHRPLNIDNMREGATYLLGQHDFSAFRASQCQANTPVRTVYKLDIARIGDLVILEVQANAFLYHMVRNIVGVLKRVGEGERPPQWVGEVLATRDRTLGGVTASATGLYLVCVAYPRIFDLPDSPPGPHFLPYPLGKLPEQ